jgi:SAM-dependent methyltransferase
MIELAKSRVSAGVDYHVADLEGNLPFLSDGSFDLVIAPLVMDYLRDWQEVFMKFNRLLKPGGWLVFSSGHPMFDAKYYNTADYFATELVRCTWKGFGVPVEMPSYRRSLSSAINPLLESGFEIVQILEPKPTEHFQRADPVKYKRLMCEPCFLCIKARKAA